MEMHGLVLCLQFAASIFSLAAGIAISFGISRAMCHRKFLNVLFASDKHQRASLLMMRGCAPLRPLARRLLLIPVVDDFVSRTLNLVDEYAGTAADGGGMPKKTAGNTLEKESALSLLLVMSLGAGFVFGLLSASIVCGIAAGCCAVIGVVIFVRMRGDKHYLVMREDVPDALRSMITCFRSGSSLVQTLRQVSCEAKGSLGELFGVATRRLEMGASSTEALSVLHEQKRIPELVFVAVALDVQHQSGGSIAPVLEAACDSVEGELELMRSLRVQTAQAKLSARIVTLMPFVLVAIFSLVSPDFMMPFFSSVLGMGLLVLALSMQVAGILAVRHILKVEAG